MWGRSCLFDKQKLPVHTPRAARRLCNRCPFTTSKGSFHFAIAAFSARERTAFASPKGSSCNTRRLLLHFTHVSFSKPHCPFLTSHSTFLIPHTAHFSLYTTYFSFPTLPISRFTFPISHSPHCPFLTSHSTFQTSHSSFHIPKIRAFAKWSGCKKIRPSTPYVVIFI